MAMPQKVAPLLLAFAILALALALRSSAVSADDVRVQEMAQAPSAVSPSGDLEEYKLGMPLYRVKDNPSVQIPAYELEYFHGGSHL